MKRSTTPRALFAGWHPVTTIEANAAMNSR